MPILMGETLAENKYGPATIPLILQIGASYDRRDFASEIFAPLGKLMSVTKPPEMSLAALNSLKILLDRIDPDDHYDLVFPIVLAALQTDDLRLQVTAVRSVPLIVATMAPSAVRNVAIPKISDLLGSSLHHDVVSSCVESLTECLSKIDPDTFCEIALPKVLLGWRRIRTSQLAGSIFELLKKLEPSLDVTMRAIIPLIADILAFPAVDPPIQLKLAKMGQAAFQRILVDRKLEERSVDCRATASDPLLEELTSITQPGQRPSVPLEPPPKPIPHIVPRPDPGEVKRPKWSAALKPKTPPTEPAVQPDEEKFFWESEEKPEREELDAAVVNEILEGDKDEKPPLKTGLPAKRPLPASRFAKKVNQKNT
jgi:hypothetical protein